VGESPVLTPGRIVGAGCPLIAQVLVPFALVLDCPLDEREALEYALTTVFHMAGFGLERAPAEGAADRSIVYCGPADRRPASCALALPLAPAGAWRAVEPQVAEVDGVAVLYVGERPRFCAAPGELGFDLANAALYLLTLQAERDGARDAWGRLTADSTRLRAWGVLDRPLLERYSAAVAAAIGGDSAHEAVPRWPGNKDFAVALTHDVDGIAALTAGEAFRYALGGDGPAARLAGARRAAAAAIATLRRRPLPRWDLTEWTQLEERYGTRSTFFLFRAARDHPTNVPYRLHDPIPFDGGVTPLADAAARLERGGWEIGLHASYHTSGDAGLLAQEVAALRAESRTHVRGVRQHYLHLEPERSWSAHESVGMAYDATLGFNDAAGYRAGTGLPFRPFDGARRRPHGVWVLPLVAQDIALLRELERGEVTRLEERCRTLLEEARAVHGLVTLSWHPNLRADRPDLWHAYAATLEWLADQRVWLAPAAEVVDWWEKREARLAAR
jgi:hypothetical protein